MRNRRNVPNGLDLQAGSGERLNGGFATASRTLNAHMHAPDTGRQRFARGLFGGNRCGKRRRLLGTLEASLA